MEHSGGVSMQKELVSFLDLIKLDKTLRTPFEEAIITRAEYDPAKRKFEVVITLDYILDCRIYKVFISNLVNFPAPVNVTFSLRNFADSIAVNTYYGMFINEQYKDGPFFDNLKKLKIDLVNEKMVFTINSQMLKDCLESVKDRLIDDFAKIGINYPLDIVLVVPKDDVFQTLVEQEVSRIEQQGTMSTIRVVEETKPNTEYIKRGYEKIQLNQLTNEDNMVEFLGRIFDIEVKELTRSNNRKIFSLFITDDTDSVMIKARETKKMSLKFLESLKVGMYINVKGGMIYDSFARDFTFEPAQIDLVEIDDKRYDDAKDKRVELHLHTKMSAMDGVASIEEYVNQAIAWGHKAIALTDHGVLQAYPEAQKATKGKDIKMIYGMEGYIVDNEYKPAHNLKDIELNSASYVIFDLETTGLSSHYDSIIEIGAVKMENGMVVDQFQTLVNPQRRIDKYISKITNITDEMLISAPTINAIMPRILSFFGDSILVAHNGMFDVGFINAALARMGKNELTNPIIDTLDLAHCIFPDLKRYSLGYVCRYVNVEYNEEVAHRADYDARVLGDVFEIMLSKTMDLGVSIHSKLNELTPVNGYKSKRPYHMTFLVKNAVGLKNLYKMVSMSHIEYITSIPLIPRDKIEQFREGLLIGSACFNGEIFDIAQTGSYEELKEAIKYYDYIEVQPLANYSWLVDTHRIINEERLVMILKDIVKAAKEMGKIVVATGDCHYLDPRDKIYRDVYVVAQAIGARLHPLNDRRCKDNPNQHFRTTNEMIEGLSYLDDIELQKELVVTNTNKIADMIEQVYPIKDKLFTPELKGINADEEIKRMCHQKAHELYGETLPPLVEERMEHELSNICDNGYAVIYYLAYRLVAKSKSDGYLVGSRGSVGSSFVAALCGITEVNPLPPHYLCPNCHHVEFFMDGSVKSGFDLDDKSCPECGHLMNSNGQNIPFETFLGLKGDKVPDIDLNFSRDYQATAHNYTKVLLGENNVFRAGTISTVATKTAFGYARNYFETHGRTAFREAELRRLALKCTDVKRTTGQHPAGIIVVPDDMEVYDFTPIQYPADEVGAAWKTTHFKFEAIHDEILKLDILGHVDPAALRMLQDLTGINPEDVPMNDKRVLSLFTSVKELGVNEYDVLNHIGSAGVPEFGTTFVKGVLEDAKPVRFSELVQISGLTHGTDVWRGNAQDLIRQGTCGLMNVIGCRDDIMGYLAGMGIDKLMSFKIMEAVRKGKGLTKEMEGLMVEHNIPKWYITSCKKIKYLFPKAHATAYVVMALRIAWFKVHYPLEYYATYFTVRCDAYDIQAMIEGHDAIKERLERIRTMIKERSRDLTNKEKDLEEVMEVALEMTARGYSFSNISLDKSEAKKFVVDHDNNALIPPYTVIDGLGGAVANSIVEARNKQPFISKQDFINRTQINTSQIKIFEEMHVLDELDEDNQLAFKLF